ncbi:MAG: heme ABC transporter ATP-binding protein [Saprospiraceae bacterium]
MLKADNISFKIGTKELLKNVSVEFAPGKINLIIGPNGAGKSTLVKILSGMLMPSVGEVFYSKRNIKNIPMKELAQFRALLSQSIELTFPLTVWEVVVMGRYPFFSGKPSTNDISICKETISFFDLKGLANQNYMTLSGGEKQRVHFARVASQIWEPNENDCHYLILDEPLSFLDIYYQFDFMHKITDLIKQRNWLVLGVVHDLNLAGKYADHIVLMNNGSIIADGSKEHVLTQKNILEAYRLHTEVLYENKTVHLHF